MAFTRNRNTQGNYDMEQKQHQRQFDMSIYQHSANGKSNYDFLAGRGLIQQKMHSNLLSNNFADIESDLRGIGSLNLAKQYDTIIPDLKKPVFLDIYKEKKIIVPKPFTYNLNERPQFH